jgi:glycosyltransferase involved in cell wall biosynthesis
LATDIRVDSPRTDAAPRVQGRASVSVLIPAFNEAENLPLLMQLASEMAAANRHLDLEFVVVDDGSTDETPRVLADLRSRHPLLRIARHRNRRGIAEALRTGYENARGDILVFYPADLQYRPEDIPALVAPITDGSADIVAGYKQGKYEKAFVSGIYNRLSRKLFALPVRDLNSVKAYRREVMESIPARPDWHRYMVAIAAADGYSLAEVPVPLYPRHAGRSKFGLRRIPVGVLDMLAVWFELRFAKKPLLLFGMLGAALFVLGVMLGGLAVVWRLFIGEGWRPIINLVETCVIVGSVLFCTGLVGETIAGLRAEVGQLRRRVSELDSTKGGADNSELTNEP